MEFGERHSYTFVVTNTPEGAGLENLVLFSEKEGGYRMVLVRYDFTEKEMDYPKTIQLTGKDFEMIELNENQLSGQMAAKKDPCIQVLITWCSGNANHPGGWEADGDACYAHESKVVWSNCGSGGSGGDIPNGEPLPRGEPQSPPTNGEPGTNDPYNDPHSGGGGSSEPNEPGTDVVLSPMFLANAMENFVSGLSPNLQDWLGDHGFFYIKIRKFFGKNGFLPGTAAFAAEAINAAMNDDNPEPPNINMEAAFKLSKTLLKNPFLLLEMNCNQLPQWQDLAQHTPPQSVENKIENLQQNHDAMLGDWDIQFLDEAGGAVVNMDYFSVNITSFPTDPATGQPFTADDFLDYFRDNINNFCSPTTFEPYCEISAICQQETNLWNSSNPLGALVKLNIPLYNGRGGDIFGNDGVVICSEFQSDYWYFMTIEAPYDDNHPVSGTRQFGYVQNADGSYDFFVRGVDRFNSGLIFSGLDLFSDNPFFGADDLWETFQDNLSSYVNSNGGSSKVETPVINRPNWEKVEDVLMGNRPITDLGCE